MMSRRPAKRALGLLKRGVKHSAIAYDHVRRPESGLTILAYHRVGGGTSLELDMAPADFAAQMTWLGASGRARDIDDGLATLTGNADALGGDNPGDPVVVTFDDGTADFVEHALPALVEASVPATYYVATRFIDHNEPFPDNGTPLSWSGLAEAVSTGLVTVGSHTHSHAVMDKLTPSEAADELRRAKELIEDHLGVEAAHFAYPKGVFGGAANEIEVGRFHRSAALAGCRNNPYGKADQLRLERAPIQRSDSMDQFIRKVNGGMRLEGTLRAALNKRRYESALN